MNILFIGDIVGKPGRSMVETYLSKLRDTYKPTVTIVNGENAAHGRGITEQIYRSLLSAGAQVVTMGNHTWDNKQIFDFIDQAHKLVRPANFPEGTPGQGLVFVNINGTEVAVINLQGRAFLPPLDCPFKKADELVQEASQRTSIIFVDFHAEATSEKIAMGQYLDGRVTAVVGTHTHVPTADERILPKGTAYVTDVGMTGPYDGILGMESSAVIQKFKTALPVRFEVAEGREQLSAVFIKADKVTGKAQSIQRVLINDDHPFMEG
ncbi:TIGR00282 family metallophosphoesterase [Bacillaceae bacterium SIJ1]|uniref:TIGR00282 family metallophosphoesterase n=1 Tax=Litoribacterium kuwaitense TaxID=1398745 RepID=UPI0013ECC08C|nr:TIGR00282 family metallophosphoesterase [Litoribacterium kuwaitense]NGP44063.1 TIGR00282 family metallophosphoesterase [Litoribacterium kuwaitense]